MGTKHNSSRKGVRRGQESVVSRNVIKLVQALPDKQCSSDPLPTWLLKANVSVLVPFLCRLFCWSLQHGVVPSRMKSSYVTPILKKAGMDSADPTSYRPISNLAFLLVTAARSCAIEDEVILCYTDIKESWHGLGRFDILSADNIVSPLHWHYVTLEQFITDLNTPTSSQLQHFLKHSVYT